MNEDSEFTTQPLDDSGEVLFSSGGTADCYKRIDGNRAYCIKRPKAAWRQSEDYMNLFRKEFSLGIELEHPNIVRYFDYGEDEQGPYIKMDYVDGESLEHFAAKHPGFFDSKKNRRQLLDELLDAMAYLHGKQMLHLDLKPGNILITNKGHHVKLIDLGFGWTEGFLHDAGYSRDYSAPEQLRRQTDLIGVATDVYALGKIMQRFHLANDSVVKRCLKEDPKERFQSIEALRIALQPKRWPLVLMAVLLLGALGWWLSTTLRPNETGTVAHDTLYIMQVDTVFMPELTPQLTLEDSLKLFKEELQNALAPTFSSCYVEIDGMLGVYSDAKGYTAQDRLEIMQLYMDKALATGRGIIKEKTNTLHLSSTAKPHYDKAAQEVIDYYLRDYRKLKKQLEK
jgi:tRNA A-37 threonylcarbamoyl transferase component Bud32